MERVGIAGAFHRPIQSVFSNIGGTRAVINFLALDKVQKPYYCGIKNPNQRCHTTTVLLGLAPALSTRASAAHSQNISVRVSRVRSVRPLD